MGLVQYPAEFKVILTPFESVVLLSLYLKSSLQSQQVAVAGAPVTSWQLYDTGYTERYLDRLVHHHHHHDHDYHHQHHDHD